jgi:Glyoxalase-like domain
MAERRIRSIVFDCERPSALARFWAEALRYSVRAYTEDDIRHLREQGIEDVEDDPSVVIDPPGEGPTFWFNRVPERKVVKNRVHVDINLESAEEVDRFLALGARILRPFGAVEGEGWAIMADPEGNEFCVFPPPE